MTEKRFNLRAGYYHNYTGICRNKEENLTTNKVVDLLNEQEQEISDLKKWLSTVPQLENKIKELKEENEGLKQDIEYLEEKIKENEWHWNTIDEDRDVWHYKCTQAEKRVKELKTENEQLKKEKEEVKSKAESFVELYERDFGKKYYTPPRSGKTVRIQLWIVRKILDEIGILELYGDVE